MTVVTFIAISSMEGYYKPNNNTSENGATNLWLPTRRELWIYAQFGAVALDR